MLMKLNIAYVFIYLFSAEGYNFVEDLLNAEEEEVLTPEGIIGYFEDTLKIYVERNEQIEREIRNIEAELDFINNLNISAASNLHMCERRLDQMFMDIEQELETSNTSIQNVKCFIKKHNMQIFCPSDLFKDFNDEILRFDSCTRLIEQLKIRKGSLFLNNKTDVDINNAVSR